jgi:hypothetical protein
MADKPLEYDDGSADVPIPDEEVSDVVENDDGSADVEFEDEKEPPGESSFYTNLVEKLNADDPKLLDDISLELIEKIELDIEARKPRDELYAEGIKRTGLGNEAPGGASFLGASRAVHPLLIQSAIDFQARAMKEVFPAGGPVKTQIYGIQNRKRLEKAERVGKCMNWQLTKQIAEFRPNLERTQMQASLNGASYLVWRNDEHMKRAMVCSANTDKVIIPYATSDFYSAERITFIDDITDLEYNNRIADGIYEGEAGPASSMVPEESESEQARHKVEGKEQSGSNDDGVRRMYVVNTYLSGVEEALGSEDSGRPLPYLIHICDTTYKVKSVVRNWEERDEKHERMHWITEIPFVPWEESNVGLVHIIGGLSAAATGSLRALLDSAHVNNIPTAAYLKGSGLSGQSKTLSPTQLIEIAGGVGADDIRKVIMQMPYNEPSPTLFQLLGFVVEAGQGVIRTTFDKLSENNTNLPVGTTYALIEQGLVVVSAIMGRQHYAMQHAFKVLHRINRMYLEEEEIKDEAGEVLAYRSDFSGAMDVVPVSDPNIPSDAHRFAQTQALSQRADAKPQMYNTRAVELEVLKRMKVADPERFLVAEQVATEMNAANENVSASLGRPIVSYPEQDHISHLKTHIDFMQNPMFGFLSIIAPSFLPAMLQHIKEHLVMWYISKVYEGMKTSVEATVGNLAAMGDDFSIDEIMKIKDPQVRDKMDKLIATVSDDVLDAKGDMEELMAMQVIQVVQKAQQILEQYKPPAPMDPAQAQLAKTQITDKTANRKIDVDAQAKVASIDAQRQKTQTDAVGKDKQIMTVAQTAAMQEQAEMQRVSMKEANENTRTDKELMMKERLNVQDNNTALAIAAAEIESGENVAVSTGGDSSPGA